MKCPECESENMPKFGFTWAKDKVTGQRVRVQQRQCGDCGRITRHPLGIETARVRKIYMPREKTNEN